MTASNTLGEYLRARRELVEPAELSLASEPFRTVLAIYHAEPGPASARALAGGTTAELAGQPMAPRTA